MIFNSLYLVYVLLAVILVFVAAIGFLRVLFATIYAKGNSKDTVLLNLMEQAGIPNWQTLQQKSGVSSTVIWLLRDGEGASVKLSELKDVANALLLPLGAFLKKLDLIE
ncbi:MAG: helix-turn-helix domain-containing protein [Rivularia sp. (in: Bacteria)]|nr:helix-turn-helix domain-containing protein [Rivularia sp. MS3]